MPTFAMPNAKLYMPSAPGRLKLLLAKMPCWYGTVEEYVPKQCKCEKARKKAAVNGVYTEEHLGACRTGQGLTDGKDLLVLGSCQS